MYRHVSCELRAVVEHLATDGAAELQQRLVLDDVVFDARMHHESGACAVCATTHVAYEALGANRMLQFMCAQVVLIRRAVAAQVTVEELGTLAVTATPVADVSTHTNTCELTATVWAADAVRRFSRQ